MIAVSYFYKYNPSVVFIRLPIIPSFRDGLSALRERLSLCGWLPLQRTEPILAPIGMVVLTTPTRLHAERFWIRFSSNWPSGMGDIVRKKTTFFCTAFLISAAEIGLSKMVKSISR